MSKAKENKILSGIVFSLLILLLLAVGTIAFMPLEAKAYTERYGYTRPYSNKFNNTFTDPDYGGSSSVSAPSSNTSNNTGGSVLGASTTKNTSATQTSTESQTQTEKSAAEIKNLTANAIYGEGSLFPSSLVGWIALAIVILLIVILSRKMFGLESKYHATPLKHS